jgi:hypothetical protein
MEGPCLPVQSLKADALASYAELVAYLLSRMIGVHARAENASSENWLLPWVTVCLRLD